MCVFEFIYLFIFFLIFQFQIFKDVDLYEIYMRSFRCNFSDKFEGDKNERVVQEICNEMIFFYYWFIYINLLPCIFLRERHWSVNYFAYKNCFLVHARVSITLIPAGDRNVLSISNRSICISDIGKFWNFIESPQRDVCRLFKIECFLDRMQGTIL